MSTSLHFVHMKYKYEVIINIPIHFYITSFQFSSVTQSCPTLFDPMNHNTPGLPVHHQLPESTQTHVHRVGDAIQPSHPLSSPSPPALNLLHLLVSSHSSLHCTHTDYSTLKNVFVFHTSCLCPWNFSWVSFYSLSISSILKVKVLVAQSSPTLCNPMDYSPLSSSVHGICQARILEWIAIHSLLQGIFLTERSNLGLLHCRQILYHLSHQGSPSPVAREVQAHSTLKLTETTASFYKL